MDTLNYGQNLQSFLASSTMFWLITIALVFFIVVVMVGGFKRVASPGRLKWLLLHTLSIFLIGYFLKDYILNKYLVVLIFAFFITLLSGLYRYFMFHVKDSMKNRIMWFFINLVTFLIIQILYEVLNVIDSLLKILFASFCLTLVGSLVHKDFKGQKERHSPYRKHIHKRHYYRRH